MEKSLRQADFNLLKVLHVLLEERNVSRAAEKLFVTQSAVSRSLNRLRQMFGDPLLVRSSQGLVLTARAKQLAVEVNETMNRIGGLLEAPAFDPALARGNVRIAAPESFVLGVMPRLALKTRQEAPGLLIESLHLPESYLQLLEGGYLDFVITHGEPHPEPFISTPLMSVTPRFWFRKSHPLRKKREIGLVDICSYPVISFHAQNVSRAGYRALWQMIKKAQLPPPQIVMDTSHLFVALDMLVQSPSIMLGPEYLSEIPAFKDALISKPMESVPTFGRGQTTLSLIQHERTARSPVHLWLVERIRQEYQRMNNTQATENSRNRGGQ